MSQGTFVCRRGDSYSFRCWVPERLAELIPKHALRNAGVDKTLRDAVMGHDHDDVAERYGLDEDEKGYALPVLAAAIAKISYPGLVLSIVQAEAREG